MEKSALLRAGLGNYSSEQDNLPSLMPSLCATQDQRRKSLCDCCLCVPMCRLCEFEFFSIILLRAFPSVISVCSSEFN